VRPPCLFPLYVCVCVSLSLDREILSVNLQCASGMGCLVAIRREKTPRLSLALSLSFSLSRFLDATSLDRAIGSCPFLCATDDTSRRRRRSLPMPSEEGTT